MPAMLAARLYRVLPLLAILAIIGIVVYIFMSWRYTPARAKEAVIKIFIALNGGLSILFALATLYAWIESNGFVADFFITCLATTLIMLGITFICRRNFFKHNPNYRWRRWRSPWRRSSIRVKTCTHHCCRRQIPRHLRSTPLSAPCSA